VTSFKGPELIIRPILLTEEAKNEGQLNMDYENDPESIQIKG
jgi:hypothetical protein